MAITFTVTVQKVWAIGDRKAVIADVAMTGTPTGGGDALTGTALGLENELNAVQPMGAASLANGTGGLALGVIHASTQVLVVPYVQVTAGATTALQPFTATTANYSVRVLAIGKGSAAT